LADHPPMQMDGNFGITAAVCEMLLQSHADELHLLPALPAAWPTGQVQGLRARGGYTVDLNWNAGQLTEVSITAVRDSRSIVRVHELVVPIAMRAGQTLKLNGQLQPIAE
jgi:alpha-L-fucosidase 2